jgi:hypothetical protein
MKFVALLGLEFQFEPHLRPNNLVWGWNAINAHFSQHMVEPLVAENDAVVTDFLAK